MGNVDRDLINSALQQGVLVDMVQYVAFVGTHLQVFKHEITS